MRFTLVAALAAFSATVSQAQFQLDLYHNTDCTDFITSFTGTGSGPQSVTDVESNIYIGSVFTTALDQWTTEFDTSVGCVFTTITCCEYGPTCSQGVVGTSQQCILVDQTVTGYSTLFTVCDSVCLDTDYDKRGLLNATTDA